MTINKKKIKSLIDHRFSLLLILSIALVGMIGMIILFFRVPTMELVYVPVDDIPAYHYLNNTSLVQKWVDKNYTSDDCIKQFEEWNATYTTKKLYANESVLKSNLSMVSPNSTYSNNSTIFSLTIPASDVYGIGMAKGDDVEAVFIPYNGTGEPDKYYTMYVMDLILFKEGDLSSQYILVVAMDKNNASGFINNSTNKYKFIKRYG